MTLTEAPRGELPLAPGDARRPAPPRETMRRRSIRTRIVAAAMVVGVVPLFVGAVAAYGWQRSEAIGQVLDRLDSVAAAQEARLDDFLTAGVELLRHLSERPDLMAALRDYAMEGGEDPAIDVARALRAAAASSSRITALALVDVTGEVVSSVGSVAAALRNELYLERAKESIVVGEVVHDGAGQVIHVAAGPVTLGELYLGTIVVAESMTPVLRAVSDYTGLGTTGETTLATRDAIGDAVFIAPLRFDPGATLSRIIPQEQRDAPMTLALATSEAVVTDGTDYRGVSVLASIRYLPLADWGVVVKLDTAEALSGVHQFGKVAIPAVTLLALGALLIALVVSRQLTSPLRDLTTAAVAVSRGERNRRVEVVGHDEVGALAAAFNVMTEELTTLAASLEEKVAERTAEIEQRKRELEDLIKHKENFVATVSHELRTPLSSVLASIDLLTDPGSGLAEEERHEVLRLAAQEAGEISNLIEDLLVAARAEAGSLRVTSVPVNLKAQIAQVLEGLDQSMTARISVSAEPLRTAADPARVRQIVRNLVTNAFRYGGPRIEVRTSSEGGLSHVVVVDDGPGVPEGDRETIFRAYQTSQGVQKAPGSIGLGLAISRELARLMGGDLTYAYEESRSVFDLALPTLPEDVAAFAGDAVSLSSAP